MRDENVKACPLLGGRECFRTGCAWWNHLDDECIVATLATLATLAINKADRGE